MHLTLRYGAGQSAGGAQSAVGQRAKQGGRAIWQVCSPNLLP